MVCSNKTGTSQLPIPSADSSIEVSYQCAAFMEKGIGTKLCALNATVFPIWLDDRDCFWYERDLQDGKEYRLVDASLASNRAAFNHASLASALSKAVGREINASNLPICKVKIDLDPLVVTFRAFDQFWRYQEDCSACIKVEPLPSNELISPDGRYVIFTKDYNLWIRDRQNDKELALTKDGEKFNVYGRGGTVWGPLAEDAVGIQVLWSRDSTRLLTVQRDNRKVKSLPVIHHVPLDGSIRPEVEMVKSASPGDKHVEEYRLLAIDIKTGNIQEADYRRIPVSRIGYGFFDETRGWWAADSRRAYFVDQERGDQAIYVVEFDTYTGKTRVLFSETSDTQITLTTNPAEGTSLVPLPESNELLWFSERSGWAHLYLYDLCTGELKNAVTQGNWVVRDIIGFDPTRRELYLQTGGRVSDRDPYYRDVVRVHIDTAEMTTLLSSDHDYFAVNQASFNVGIAKGMGRDVSRANCLSGSCEFFVVTRSRADELPVSLLVNRKGSVILEIETADMSAVYSHVSKNWRWPEPVKLLAADNKTDIYGLVFRPSNFSEDKTYPVVSHVFNVPDALWVSKGAFSNGVALGIPYFDAAAISELGFIVVQIDGRGTPCRQKAFMDQSYGWIPSASMLEDHIAGIRQLAKRYPYMDLNRVGITSHASGGPGGIQGLLEHPDFYKVGINFSAHDSRLGLAPVWGDKYEGVAGPTKNHKYPEELVDNLKGKLLLMHGMLYSGNGFPVTATLRLVEALQKANKDFDLILIPSIGAAPNGYLNRRAWDFLVRHLLDTTPPKEFKVTTNFDHDW